MGCRVPRPTPDCQPKEHFVMDTRDTSPFSRALAQVEAFSEKAVAVMPEKPGKEMLAYVSQITGEDPEKLARLYQVFVSMGRLDKFEQEIPSGMAGFAEDHD